ncbi:MAG: DUF333 domain-containing protein [Candidatus ainarchaeum sp.]|nr:DUF333 domain-containing protein [Candidatus ainarchaeum sp.]
MNIKKIIIFVSMILFVVVVYFLLQPKAPENTQIANPASVFCEQKGGSITLVNDENGSVGYCNLPDGLVVEEWEYYRNNQ